MDCNQTRGLIDADADGELDLVRHLELAAHLRVCPDCTRQAENVRARRAALRESLPRFTAPPQLAGKVRVALQKEGAAVAAPIPASRRPSPFRLMWTTTGLAASVALLIGYAWGDARARADFLVNEAVNEHVRSLQGSHLTDVASTDRHTVKPWFAGKLDFSPPVVDLAAAGFPLTGGRLEQIDGRPAAALVFHRRQHAINLFIWPANAGGVAARVAGSNGYQVESWSNGGFNFLAVSEIPTAELGQFAAAFRAAAD